MSKTAFLFPGQGAQVVGMGRDVVAESPAGASVFEQANDLLGFDLRQICFEGPVERLYQTDISQPAIYVTSLAVLAAIKERCGEAWPQPGGTAGLSLGEYTALQVAGVFDFATGLRLVRQRGQYMQAAADASSGSMVSIIGLDAEGVNRICEAVAEVGILVAANYNCPGQIVVSGESAACQRVLEIAESHGAGKTIELSVAGAFHSPLMAPAARDLEAALQEVTISPPRCRVYSNVSGDAYSQVEEVRSALVDQLQAPVRWDQIMQSLLRDGYDEFYEIGPGRVLTGLLRKIERRANIKAVGTVAAIEKLELRGSLSQ